MNETIRLLKEHRSYRDFDENYEIPENELQAILDASRQAASWMNGQAYSIMVVKDKEIRQQLVAWNPGNPHMLKSSVFLIFVADLHRTKMVSEHYQVANTSGESADHLLVAVTDTAMAMQNAIVAAESLKLGCVPVGSIRKNSQEIAEILDLPDYMMPLCGVSIGKPTVEMQVKPRLPEETVVHYDTYRPYNFDSIAAYDKTMEEFAEARETKLWSVKFADYYAGPFNTGTDKFLAKHHLLEK
ncbi:FMN reductase [NAD(P)H] [Enterococcus sp. PF1-24]|uniref:nitroreductase family protein n=1 Tax=unclassified Enterococcus TaxID=2608891 RepID=UPI002475C132|nr:MULTISPECIES: nitroreductase family protein [unclassified Enterococcus]MDH6364211.1 FMN reductase [NAD(P)H] [Enterococcus sp. PFB1-1]MDH6401312.1 FMN reductase [NAD(P)H] [Enterococcus sp. PF1-24]